MHDDVIDRDLLELEIERHQDFLLHLDELFLAELLPADLVEDYVQLERIDLLVLRGSEHRHDAQQVKV